MCVCQDHARTGGREEHAAGHQRCRRVLNKKSKKQQEQKKQGEKNRRKKELAPVLQAHVSRVSLARH